MSNELFFIPIIEKALYSDSPEDNILRAFDEIKALGIKSEYKEGFENFEKFISEIMTNSRYVDDSVPNKDLLEEGLNEIRKIYSYLFNNNFPHTGYNELIIKCDGNVLNNIRLSKSGHLIQINNAEPGMYSIELDNGLIIWKKELDKSFLVNEKPSEEEYLTLAAKSNKPSYEESLLGGDLNLKIISDDYYGKIVITIKSEE